MKPLHLHGFDDDGEYHTPDDYKGDCRICFHERGPLVGQRDYLRALLERVRPMLDAGPDIDTCGVCGGVNRHGRDCALVTVAHDIDEALR